MIGKWLEYKVCGEVMQPFRLTGKPGAAHVDTANVR
jgi:hypothetical protein